MNAQDWLYINWSRRKTRLQIPIGRYTFIVEYKRVNWRPGFHRYLNCVSFWFVELGWRVRSRRKIKHEYAGHGHSY